MYCYTPTYYFGNEPQKTRAEKNLTCKKSEKKARRNFKYKYNGKELQDELGLNVYDYEARIYDMKAPHFWQIDPLAEKYYELSPYVYVANNPLLYVDKDGKKIIIGDNSSQAITLLSMIAATNKGNQVIRRLVSSRSNYKLKSIFFARNSAYTRSGVVKYPTSVWTTFGYDNGAYNSLYILGHEINHAYDDDIQMGFPDRLSSETNSLYFTNYLRSVYGDGDDLRTYYTGIPDIRLSDNEKIYNRDGEQISSFTETYSKALDDGTFIKGFSYEKKVKGKTSKYYMIAVKNNKNSFNYVIFDNSKDYNKRLKSLKSYLKINDNNEKNRN